MAILTPWDEEQAYYAEMPPICKIHEQKERYLHEQDCQACRLFMWYVREHP